MTLHYGEIVCVVTNGLNVLQNNGEVRIHLKLAIISIDSLHSTLYDSCFLYFLTSRLNKKCQKSFYISHRCFRV